MSTEEPDPPGASAPESAPAPAAPVPESRAEPLPWQLPKSPFDDPEALARVRAIMASPTYRQADEDPAFLQRDELRGVRLELDYLKPELHLEAHGIAHTVTVFGSTRILEPAAAERRLREARAALAARPDDPRLARAVARAERIAAKSCYYEVARALGRIVGSFGERLADGRAVVMTGGGPGIMEAANRGAFEAGARTVGLNITLPHEQYPNPYITPDLCFSFHYFALRKLHFLQRARALVIFPGGYGTMDELFETLTLIQTRKIRPIPVVLVGRDFWRRAVDFDFLAEEGVIDEEDRHLFWFAETAEEIWQGIRHWYRAKGEPLFDGEAEGAAGEPEEGR